MIKIFFEIEFSFYSNKLHTKQQNQEHNDQSINFISVFLNNELTEWWHNHTIFGYFDTVNNKSYKSVVNKYQCYSTTDIF